MSSETTGTASLKSTPASVNTSWRLPLLLYGLSLAFLIAFYWPTVTSMVEIWWRSETFAHGFLILPISLYLVWLKREQLAAIQPRPSFLGLLALVIIAPGWLMGNLVEVQVVQQLALVGMLIAVTWSLLGTQVVWTIMFPLGFLFFMVPIGEFLIPPMMEFTAAFSVRMIQLTNIPVYWEGFYISLPSGDWSIVEGCSGVRYLIASVAVGVLYAYMFYHSWWRRAAFIVLAIATPVIANGLRAFMIIMIGHFSDMKLATGVDHLIYGWVFFGLVIMLMFWIGSFWWDKALDQDLSAEGMEQAPAPADGAYWWAGPLVLAALIAAPLVIRTAHHSGDASVPVIPVPQAGGGWTLVDDALSSWRPRFLGPTATRFASYQRDGAQVDLFLYYYSQQSRGAELVNSQNLLIPQKHPVWQLRQTTPRSMDVHGRTFNMPESLLRSRALSLLVWEWFWIDGSVTSNDYVAKFLEAWMRLTKPDQGAFGIVLSTPLEERKAQSREVLQGFAESMWPAIETSMRDVD